MAGIALEKHLPDATMSRAIIINMRRKMPGEKVGRLRYAEQGLFEELASKLARFGENYQDDVRRARPILPNELSDRAQDNWEPLLAIAGCAGDEWIRRATKAALLLSGESDTSQSVANELLADIHHAFDRKNAERIATSKLIDALVEDEEAAWATYNRGKPITARQLGRMLKGYSIHSKNIRIGYEQSKGYERSDFKDAFSRYLSHPSATPENICPNVPDAANLITTGRDAGRTDKSGTVSKLDHVPLEPLPDKAWDDGTDKSPVLTVGGKVEVF